MAMRIGWVWGSIYEFGGRLLHALGGILLFGGIVTALAAGCAVFMGPGEVVVPFVSIGVSMLTGGFVLWQAGQTDRNHARSPDEERTAGER